MNEHSVRLGETTFVLRSESPRVLAAARAWFAGYEAQGADWTVTIAEADPRDLGDGVIPDELALRIVGKSAEARVAAMPDLLPPGSLQNLLRLLLVHDLASRGGLLLHASSCVVAGRARAFFGKSGAGKSTLARGFPAGSLLSDEITIVTGDAVAHRAPFTGEMLPPPSPLSAPLAALFAIEHGAVYSAERLATAEALRRLLPCVLNVGHDRELSARLFDNAAALCQRVPIFVGRFPLAAAAQPWIDT